MEIHMDMSERIELIDQVTHLSESGPSRSSYQKFQFSTTKMSLAGARLQAKSAEYQKLQGDLAVLVDKRTRLDAQLSENEMVKKARTLSPSVRSPSVMLVIGICEPHSEQ
jgi:hypothetical protein